MLLLLLLLVAPLGCDAQFVFLDPAAYASQLTDDNGSHLAWAEANVPFFDCSDPEITTAVRRKNHQQRTSETTKIPTKNNINPPPPPLLPPRSVLFPMDLLQEAHLPVSRCRLRGWVHAHVACPQAFRLTSPPCSPTVTEFLPSVPWAGKYNTIPCAAGHHIAEGCKENRKK